jgi:hypothetical protein
MAQARSLHCNKGMSRTIRLMASLTASIAALPAGYVASLMLGEQSQFGLLLAMTNALALIH